MYFYVCFFTYVCMNVCMYVCMYVSMYVCMYMQYIGQAYAALSMSIMLEVAVVNLVAAIKTLSINNKTALYNGVFGPKSFNI